MEEEVEPTEPDRHHAEAADRSPTAAELVGRLAELVDVEAGDLADQTVIEGLTDLIDLAGRIDAAMARFASVFDSRALGAPDGAATTGSWLAARTELGRPVAAGVVRTGHRLRHCPHVEAAARTGRLGTTKVRKLLEARVDVEDLFALCETDLVAAVEPLTVAVASRVIDDWRRVALATAGLDDGPEPSGDTGRNHLKLSKTFQGRWALNADLDALNGDALASAIDDWIDQKIKAGAIDPTDPRSRAGHRADALIALTGTGADHHNGSHQPRARVNLTWDADDLLGKDIADLAELDQRRCNTTTGTTLAFDQATELMCNAEIIDLLVRFGYDQSRRILGITHTRRHPTNKERRALDQRDRGCVFPGCEAPTHWCHAHHITPYEIGKATRLEDLVLLCGHHHRKIHRGFTLTRHHSTGAITVTRPDGTVIETGPARSSPHSAGQGTKLPVHPPIPPPPKRTRFSAEYLQPPRPKKPGEAA